MTPIQVVGMGLDGAAGLAIGLRQMIEQAKVLAGSDRLLSYFPDHPAQRWPLAGLEARLLAHLNQPEPALVVVLTSGDPLFFGLGRQLLQRLPPEALTFHPHVSSVQLAFNRLKLPWQEAVLVSAHGRSLLPLEQPLKQGVPLMAVLTDGVNTPGAIAQFVRDLGFAGLYHMWVCENLGGRAEQIHLISLASSSVGSFAPLNVVVLQRSSAPPALENLPLLGIPDEAFLSFRDRPGLMTKREVRLQILGQLALQSHQVVWDIGAGTGSVSVEIARLVPDGEVWAIEKTAVGHELIGQNATRFATPNVKAIHGTAPQALKHLPAPHRIFIGGSGGQLKAVLTACAHRLLPQGRIVLALATLENLAEITHWLQTHAEWQVHFLQVSFCHSIAVGSFTRWHPLNPVTLVRLTRFPLSGLPQGEPDQPRCSTDEG